MVTYGCMSSDGAGQVGHVVHVQEMKWWRASLFRICSLNTLPFLLTLGRQLTQCLPLRIGVFKSFGNRAAIPLDRWASMTSPKSLIWRSNSSFSRANNSAHWAAEELHLIFLACSKYLSGSVKSNEKFYLGTFSCSQHDQILAASIKLARHLPWTAAENGRWGDGKSGINFDWGFVAQTRVPRGELGRMPCVVDSSSSARVACIGENDIANAGWGGATIYCALCTSSPFSNLNEYISSDMSGSLWGSFVYHSIDKVIDSVNSRLLSTWQPIQITMV